MYTLINIGIGLVVMIAVIVLILVTSGLCYLIGETNWYKRLDKAISKNPKSGLMLAVSWLLLVIVVLTLLWSIGISITGKY